MQIYVEIERARLTRQLAAIQEEKGDISAAADTLQEVAVVSFEPLNTPNCSQDCGCLTCCSQEFSWPMPEGLQSGLWGLCMLTCGCYLGCQGSNVTWAAKSTNASLHLHAGAGMCSAAGQALHWATGSYVSP